MWLDHNEHKFKFKIKYNIYPKNPSKFFQEINFNPFSFFNDQGQNMRDPGLNHFNNLNSKNFDSPYVLEENVKRYLYDKKKYYKLSYSS